MSYLKFWNSAPLSRRTFLRTALATIPLPLLESMIPIRVLAQPVTVPLNGVWIHKPQGKYRPVWQASMVNNQLQFNQDASLAEINALLTPHKSKIVWFNDCQNVVGTGDGHSSGLISALSGVACEGYTNCGTVRNYRTPDHFLAAAYNKTPLAIGPSGQNDLNTISYNNNTATPKRYVPGDIFDTMFGNFNPGNSPNPELENLRARRKSILDGVISQVTMLERKVSSTDRARIDQFLTSVRETEKSLTTAPVVTCSVPLKSVAVPQSFADVSRLWAERNDTITNLIVLALRCERYNAVTWLFESEAGDAPKIFGMAANGHHYESHYNQSASSPDRSGSEGGFRAWFNFYTHRVAYLIDRMGQPYLPDGRSLLDTSVLMYSSSLGDGDHNHTGCVGLLAGTAGGKIAGNKVITQRIRYPDIHKRTLDHLGVNSTGYGNNVTATTVF